MTGTTAVLDISVAVAPRRADRAELPKRVIEGAKVDAEHSEDTFCSVDIPASFKLAVRVTEWSTEDDRCAAVEKRAAGVVKRLGAPEKLWVAADRPDLAKDACTVLDNAYTALGKAAIDRPIDSMWSASDCGRRTDGINVELYLEITPEAPHGKPWRTIAGKSVHHDASGCQLSWRQGAYDEDNAFVVSLHGECSDGHPADKLPTAFVEAVIKELAKPVAKIDPARLTYRPDEPDGP